MKSPQDPAQKERWRAIALWIGPWMIYLTLVVATVIAEEMSRHGIGWLRVVIANDVLRILAVLVIAQWLLARIVLGVRGKAWLAGLVTMLELPFAGVVYMLWAVAMIGGPINPG